MTKREQLLQLIASLKAHVEIQQEKYDIATRCLTQTRAAIVVSKMESQVGGPPLTPKDKLEFDNAIANSLQGVMDAIDSLGEMRRELRELESAFLKLRE